MSGISLYHLASELEAINEQIKEGEGEITIDLERLLDECSLAIKDKIANIIKWTISLEGDEKAIESEILRLAKLKTSRSNLRDRLREYVHTSMIRADIQKIELPTMEISVVHNPPSVDIVDADSIPAKYVTIKMEKVINKRDILADLKAGHDVPGCNLNESKTRLKVK